MTVPEILDWTSFDHFRYTRSRRAPEHADLHLADYLQEQVPDTDSLLEHLKTDRVYLWNAEADVAVSSWRVNRCLAAEFMENETAFVLSDGKWYEVRRDLLQQVEEVIGGIQPTSVSLPVYDGCQEDTYNERARNESGGALTLIHPQKVAVQTHGRIEPSDLYSADRIFLHVKRYHGTSAMSHLFSQGLVAAQLFAQNRQFRIGLNDLLPQTHRRSEPERQPTTSDYEVGYVVLGRDGGAGRLPFFGRLNLRNALQQLQPMGYRTTLTTIANVNAPKVRARRGCNVSAEMGQWRSDS